MKILSIRQPWAWLIVNGFKDIENRSWSTKYRGPVLVHTGKTMTNDDYIDARECVRHVTKDILVPNAWNLEVGGYVGVTEIVNCVSESDSPWFFGKYGFVMQNSKPIAFIKANGSLGLKDIVSGSMEEEIVRLNFKLEKDND